MKLAAAILLLLALAGCASERVAVERYEVQLSADGREIIAVLSKEREIIMDTYPYCVCGSALNPTDDSNICPECQTDLCSSCREDGCCSFCGEPFEVPRETKDSEDGREIIAEREARNPQIKPIKEKE